MHWNRKGILFCLFVVFLLTGCTAKKEKTIEELRLEEGEARCMEIAATYADLYEKAEKIQDKEDTTQQTLPQKELDRIENRLMEQDFAVTDSDAVYPTYLAHGERLLLWGKKTKAGQPAEAEMIFLRETGGFYRYAFFPVNGEVFCTLLSVEWNENNTPKVTESSYRPVLDWYITEKENLYIQIYEGDSHFEKYIFMPLQPANKELYDWNRTYILPIGYVGNNLFLCDWKEGDFGNLRFNDIFELLYYMQKKTYFRPTVNGEVTSTYIPAPLFEEVVLPYFSISLAEFRERSLYDGEKDAYPWQELFSENIVFFPWTEPVVTDVQKNSDGTITLTVDARCIQYGTDRLFTHKVTIRPLTEGRFQYVENVVTYVGKDGLPPDVPRLVSVQSQNADEETDVNL